MNIKITGSGSSIPDQVQLNSSFSNNSFYDADGNPISNSNAEIIEKFKAITGIAQRRYINDDQTVADIAIEASLNALEDAKLDPETLDYIIVAHNVGDIVKNSNQVNKISKNIRCLICQGQSVYDSNSDFAISMKLVIKKKLNEGFTEKQIYKYLKNQYGDWITYDPEFNKNTYFLWLLPILMFLLGGVIVFKIFILRKN